MNTPPRLIAIVGPTASGKSALGISLAQRLGGEIVVCDSTQIYRRFDIGTGKLMPEERQGIPHHLIDLLEPTEAFTAGEYRRRALDVLQDLKSRGKVPIFTVGTGLYFRALLDGLCDAPARCEQLRERLRRRAEKRGPAYLHDLLSRMDRQAAERIGPQDLPKIIRAIEVCVLAGRSLSEVHQAGRARLEGYQVSKIGLVPPRAALYARINQRVEAMLAAGWAAEVRRLIGESILLAAKPFQFIGYRDIAAHLQGELDEKQATQKIQQATRRYAKRQLTWFRKETGVRWFSGFGDDPVIAAQVLEDLPQQWSKPSSGANANTAHA